VRYALVALLFLQAVLLSSASAASLAGSLYRVEVTLHRTGVEPAMQSTVFVEPSKEAVLSLLHESDPIGNQLRLSVEPPFVAPNGKSVANVRVQVLEQVGRDWSLRASPSLGVELGKEATLEGPLTSSIQGARYSLSVRATLVTADEFKQLTGKVATASVPCEYGMLAPVGKQSASDGASKRGGLCCRVPCTTGYNWVLTCCGAVYCCDCGSCCYPP